jgi:hypothetical protein
MARDSLLLYLPYMKNQSTSLLHTAWTEEEKQQLDDLIAFVENYSAENFIHDVCHYLYQLLGIDNILVGFHAKEVQLVHTVCFLHKGARQPNFTYNPTDTPCSLVLDQGLYYVPFGVQSAFPDIDLLKQLGGESYLGMPLFDNHDQSLGLIVLLHHQLIDRGGFVEALLTVVSPRLESELLFSPAMP